MIEYAIKAAKEASRILLNLQSKVRNATEKEGDSTNLTTVADKKSSVAISNILKNKFPDHGFFDEEAGKRVGRSGYLWVIDPLDGTIPYFAGLPLFGVSIGLLRNDEPILGVISLPALRKLYWAEKGKGAFLNGRKIRVSKQENLSKAIVGSEFAYARFRKKEVKNLIYPLADKVRYLPILASTSVALGFVSEGIYDAYLHTAHLWDYVAGGAIVEEAGGRISDYEGSPVDWRKDWIDVVVSNNLIHNKVIRLIKK